MGSTPGGDPQRTPHVSGRVDPGIDRPDPAFFRWAVRTAAVGAGADGGAYCDLSGDRPAWTVSEAAEAFRCVGDPWSHEALIPALQGGSACTFSDLRLEPPDDGRLQCLLPLRSLVVVPSISSGGKVYGLLMIGSVAPDRFSHEIVEELTALAAHLGTATDTRIARDHLEELESIQRTVAQHLQEALLPEAPEVPLTELGVHYVPADRTAPTGGDLYDWIVLPNGDLHIALVDVLGKGVGASRDALTVVHALRVLVLDGCPLEDLLERANALVTAERPDLVATVVVGHYEPSSGKVRIVSAGHPPPIVVSKGRAREIATRGVALGWPGAGSDCVEAIELDRSEIIIFYTDGLIEATRDILRGLDSLRRAAVETAEYPAHHLARALVERALEGAARPDDSLALVLRRRTPPVRTERLLGPLEYRFSPNAASVSLARHFLSDWLTHLPVEERECHDLLLIASELCTNAIRHASGEPEGVVLRAWPEGNDIVIEVEDDGEGGLEWSGGESEPPDVEAEAGRGLFVVEALADELSTSSEPGRTVVRCVRRAVL